MSKGSFLFVSLRAWRASKMIGVMEPATTASVNSGATCFPFSFEREKREKS